MTAGRYARPETGVDGPLCTGDHGALIGSLTLGLATNGMINGRDSCRVSWELGGLSLEADGGGSTGLCSSP